MKVLGPISGFQAYRCRKWTGNPQEIWLWRPVAFDCMTATRQGDTETPLSEGMNKTLCTRDPIGYWATSILWVFKSLLQKHGLAVACCRDRDTGSSHPGICVSTQVFLEVTNSPNIELVKGFPGGACAKEPGCQCRRYKRCSFNPWVKKFPLRKAWQATPTFLLKESNGKKSLAGHGL